METASPVRVEVPSPRVEFRYAGLTRRLGWSAVALLVSACVLSPVAMDFPAIPQLAPYIVGGAMPLLLLLAALGAHLFRLKRAGTVEASDEGLVLKAGAEQRRLPWSEIESGGFEQHPDRTLLRLHRRGGNEVHITLGTAAEAEALLRALGLGTESRLRRVRFDSWETRIAFFILWGFITTCASTLVAGMVIGLAHIGETTASALLSLTLVFTPIVVFLFSSAPRLRIGADGITIEHIAGNRFVPYADLCAVTLVNRAIVLTLRDGPSISLPSGLSLGSALSHEQLAAVCEQIEAARTANPTVPEPSLLDLLARDGRPLAAWRTALQGLVGGGTYRQLPVEPAALTELLEHPRATPEQRIAAALALIESRTVGARGRVRIAAQSTADTRVQVALETVAQGEFDERKIERALRRRRE